jgi:hypothetical protein
MDKENPAGFPIKVNLGANGGEQSFATLDAVESCSRPKKPLGLGIPIAALSVVFGAAPPVCRPSPAGLDPGREVVLPANH